MTRETYQDIGLQIKWIIIYIEMSTWFRDISYGEHRCLSNKSSFRNAIEQTIGQVRWPHIGMTSRPFYSEY